MPSLFDQFQKPRAPPPTTPSPPTTTKTLLPRLSRTSRPQPQTQPDSPATIHINQRSFAPATRTTTPPSHPPLRATDARSCPALPLDDDSPSPSSPSLFRRGSLPVTRRELPLLNFSTLRSACATQEDVRTARRRVESISTSLSKFRPHLYISGDAPARDLGLLRRHNVTHVVNMEGRHAPNYHEGNLRYMRLYLRDDTGEDIRPVLDAVTRFVEEARMGGGACLVHCRQGVSRSATAVLGCVMAMEGLGAEEALRELRMVRPIASPNAGFFAALVEREREMRMGLRRPKVLVVRRHAAEFGDGTTPFVAVLGRGKRGGGLDDREGYVLQRAARHGVVAWRGGKCGEEVWERVLAVAKEIVEGERRFEKKFGGGVEGLVVVGQGEVGKVDEEVARVLRL